MKIKNFVGHCICPECPQINVFFSLDVYKMLLSAVKLISQLSASSYQKKGQNAGRTLGGSAQLALVDYCFIFMTNLALKNYPNS